LFGYGFSLLSFGASVSLRSAEETGDK